MMIYIARNTCSKKSLNSRLYGISHRWSRMQTIRHTKQNHVMRALLALSLVLLAIPASLLGANASVTEVDVNATSGVSSGVTANVNASTAIYVKGSIDVTVKAGTSTTQEITLSNPSDKDAQITLSVDGEAQSWIALSSTSVLVKAKSSEKIQATVSPPATTAYGSYTARININSSAVGVQSIFVKVKVPKLTLSISPKAINTVVKPNSTAEASVLLINSGEAEISSARLTVSGNAASMIQLNTSLVRLKAQGVAEAKLKISVGNLATGTYTGKLAVTTEDGTTSEIPITINVKMTADATANVTHSGGLTLNLGGEQQKASSTISIAPSVLATLGVNIQAGLGTNANIVARHNVTGEVSQVAKFDIKVKADAQGKLDVDTSADIKAGTKSGVYTGIVTLETSSGAKIDVPVTITVKAKTVAKGAVVIDGSDNWSSIKIKSSVTGKAVDQVGDDKAVDLVSVKVTDTDDSLLMSVKVTGDVDTSTKLYGLRFDTNLDGKTDFTLQFQGSQAILLDASGNQVASVSEIAWASKSGTLEAALDRQQIAAVIGTKFKMQVFARGSYAETIWFPESQQYQLEPAQQSTTTTTTTTHTAPPTQSSPPQTIDSYPVILGVIGATVAAAVIIVGALRRK